ncbi:MAG: Gfo/Idh/MocA family oxidoreductase, partial [Spirochaetota bacterium]
MAHADGMNYAPEGRPDPVVGEGDFRFAAVGLDHGHIIGMTQGLRDAGGTLSSVYAADSEQVASFRKIFPGVRVAGSLEEILDDTSIHMIASAAIPSERGPLGLKVLEAGKHYFSDKAPFTTVEQLSAARAQVEKTGLK